MRLPGHPDSNGRRRAGDLESAVMTVLWAADGPLVPADVLNALGDDLAYSTVMTILVRLHGKGLVEREKVGRAYSYRATVAEADVATEQIRHLLHASADRGAVVQAFLDELGPGDEEMLRRFLERSGSTEG